MARKQAAIKSFFKFLVSRGVVASNPSEDLASPHGARALPPAISAGDLPCHAMETGARCQWACPGTCPGSKLASR